MFISSVVVVTPSMSTTSKFVVPSTSKSPFASILPVKVDTPATVRLPIPTSSLTSNEVSVPTFVSEELTTPEPRVVAFSTDVLLIYNLYQMLDLNVQRMLSCHLLLQIGMSYYHLPMRL